MQRKDSGSRPPKTQQKQSPARGGMQNPGAAYTSGMMEDALMGVTHELPAQSRLGGTGYPSASSPHVVADLSKGLGGMALSEPSADAHRASTALTWRNVEKRIHAHTFSTSMYQVTFQVHRRVDFGQTVIVLGSTPELDKWKKIGPFRHELRWTEGDVWVSKEPLVTSQYFFHYKYAIVEQNKVIGWERGVDRVADLEIMPDMRNGRLYNCPTELFYDMEVQLNHSKPPATKILVLNEVWEKLTVSFMVYHPSEDQHDELLFDCPRVNARNMMMTKMPREFEWMNPKYGQVMRPWQITVQFPNEEGSNTGQFKAKGDAEMRYTFIRRNRVTGEQVWERDPKRFVDLQDPNTYRGQLGSARSCMWFNTDRCYAVNGCVFKADGNFLNPFFFRRIGDTWITLGSYPLHEMDYQRVKSSGATAILNIQNATDHRQHNINVNEQMNSARCAGIMIYHNTSVDDTNIPGYCKDVFAAANLLHQLILEQKHHVFIHCAAGVSRCTTLFLVYAALYGLPNEDGSSALPTYYKTGGKMTFDEHDPLSVSLTDLAHYLKMQYPKSTPNLDVVQMVIDENKAFILEQRRRQQEEEARRRKEKEERERQIALKKAQEEAERIRLMRLAEAEKERLRLQRLEQERAEQLRLEKLAAEEAERERQRYLKEEEDRLRRQALEDEEARLAKERAIREEELRREAEKKRLEQEAALQAEKIRLQKLAVEAAREAARIKQEQEEFDEDERRRKAHYEQEENERRHRQIEAEEQHHYLLAKQQAEEEERRRLEEIRLQQLEAEKIRMERQAYEEEEILRRKKIQEEEELERLRQKKIAEEEAHNLLLRLKCIEEEENERVRKKKEAEHEFSIQSNRLRELMNQEIQNKFRTFTTTKIMRNSSPRISEIKPMVSLEPVIPKATPLLKQATIKFERESTHNHEVAAFGDIDLLGITEAELDMQCEELFSETPVKFVARKTNELDQHIAKILEDHKLTIPIIHIKDTLYLIGSQRLNVEKKNEKLSVRVGGGYERFEDYVPRNSKYFQRTLVCHMIKSGESLEWVVEQLLQGKKIKNIHLEAQNKLNEANRFRRNSYSPVSGRSTTGGFQVQYDLSGRKSPVSGRRSYTGTTSGFSFRKTSPYALTKSATKTAFLDSIKHRTSDNCTGTAFQRQLTEAKEIAQAITGHAHGDMGTVDPSVDDSWRKDSD